MDLADQFRNPSRPILTGLFFFVVASIAVLTTRFDGGVAFIWVASAILLAELMVIPYRRWPITIACCAVASTGATGLFGLGPAAAIPLTVANLAEAGICAIVLRRTLARGSAEPLPQVAAFALVAGLIVPAFSGLLAAAATSWTSDTDFWLNWFHWYAGHALGLLIFTPILRMLLRGELGAWLKRTARHEKWEAACLLLLFALMIGAVFAQTQYPLLFLPILPLIVIAFRVGRIGAAAAIVLLTIIGGALTLNGLGPVNMIDASSGSRVQFFQFYVAICFLIALPAAAELDARKRLFQRLAESEGRYRLITDNSGDVIMNLTANGVIRYVSPSVRAVFGYAPDELVGRPIHGLIHEADLPEVVAVHRRALATPGVTFTIQGRALAQSGQMVWCETITRAIDDPVAGTVGVVSAIRDITERKAAEIELSEAANTDPLTRVANRRAFVHVLDRLILRVASGEGRGCVAVLDIDHFKQVNDTYGHAVGDVVLKAFVDRLRPSLRASDLIGRLGGEEFALILWEANLGEGQLVCERLLRAVSERRIVAGDRVTLPITFSIGLTGIDGRSTTAELIEVADKALYLAKSSGRNCLRLAA